MITRRSTPKLACPSCTMSYNPMPRFQQEDADVSLFRGTVEIAIRDCLALDRGKEAAETVRPNNSQISGHKGNRDGRLKRLQPPRRSDMRSRVKEERRL